MSEAAPLRASREGVVLPCVGLDARQVETTTMAGLPRAESGV